MIDSQRLDELTNGFKRTKWRGDGPHWFYLKENDKNVFNNELEIYYRLNQFYMEIFNEFIAK